MKIDRSNDFDGAVLNCAVRYALGRCSYMPVLVMDQITPILKDCSDKTLWCFERDVSQWLQESSRGMMDNAEAWAEFLSAVRKERAERAKHP